MPRPWRIEYEGAWYHVMNRGSARRDIFSSDLDRLCFLQLLQELHIKYKIEIHSYCLMKNHYHLCLRTQKANLNKGMQFLQSTYTSRINKRMKLDGPLFRGRYKAILVDNDIYLLNVSRYIHLNPVTINMVTHAENYKWSSALFYTKQKYAPDFLYRNEILNLFAEYYPSIRYDDFLQAGVDKETHHFYSNGKIPIFGSISFVEKIKQTFTHEMPREKLADIEGGRHLFKKSININIDDIISATTSFFEITPRSILSRTCSWPNSLARKVCIHLAVEHCNLKHEEIGKSFSNLSSRGVSTTHRRVLLLMEKCSEIKKQVDTIKSKLINLEKC